LHLTRKNPFGQRKQKTIKRAREGVLNLQTAKDSARMKPMQKVTSKAKNANNTGEISPITTEQMFEAGAHYGYGKSRRHPSVSPYIYATKNRTDIIDLEKTGSMLAQAAEFMKHLGSRRKTVILVGTKPEAKEAVRAAAESLDMPYVVERWIGGTLSNFTEIKKRILELENYRKDTVSGDLEKYTKKERVMLAKKMEKLSRYYGGLISLKKLPDALLIVDGRAEIIAQTEANKTGVPVVALANSDSNIKDIDYPIVSNDASIPTIKLFVNSLAKAYKDGLASVPEKVVETK
jgi:small subunit ribosomal protein S2